MMSAWLGGSHTLCFVLGVEEERERERGRGGGGERERERLLCAVSPRWSASQNAPSGALPRPIIGPIARGHRCDARARGRGSGQSAERGALGRAALAPRSNQSVERQRDNKDIGPSRAIRGGAGASGPRARGQRATVGPKIQNDVARTHDGRCQGGEKKARRERASTEEKKGRGEQGELGLLPFGSVRR